MSERSKQIVQLAIESLSKIKASDNKNAQTKENEVVIEPSVNIVEEGELSDIFSSDDSIKDKTYIVTSEVDSSEDDNNSETENESASCSDFSDLQNSGTSTPTTNDNLWHDIRIPSTYFNCIGEDCELSEKVLRLTNPEPIDVFNLFINKTVLDIIVRETNTYAAQNIKISTKKSRINSWTNTNTNEIRKFLGISLAMGLAQVPSINQYWSKDNLYHNKFISSIMSRDRYILLLKFIYFENNEKADTSNRLYKLDNIITVILKIYQTVMKPGRDLVIDESMVPFRGRLYFRQYIPNKTHKYGVKLYKLCSTEGYTFNLKVYTGKGDTNSEMGHSQSIVLKLLECVKDKAGRIVYADNFYSSIALAENLYKDNCLYCGTLRINRKGIPHVFSRKMKRGEIFGQEKNNTKIIKWVDKRPVLMITTNPSHDDTVIRTGKRNRKGEDILKPKCIIDYNKAKKGVDISDQMSSYHSALRKSVKWYRKVMFEILFGTTVVNAWVVYNMISNIKMGITEFRRKLAESLVISNTEDEEPKQPKKRAHTFVKPEGPGRKKRRTCKGCYERLRKTLSSREADKKVRRIASYCADCVGQPGYCLPCFNEKHN